MSAFDMPAAGTWEVRGGWVVDALLRDFGLALHQAGGLVGNLGMESEGFTAFHQRGQPTGKGGYGWAQWTADRRVSFFDWCARNSLAPASDEANYGYLCWELKTTHQSTIAALRKCNTLEKAVFSVGQTFERPAGTTVTHLPGYDVRLAYAKRAVAGAKGKIVVPPAPSPTPTTLPGNPDIVFSLVQALQHYLVDTDYLDNRDGKAIDGILGANTQDAVARFQRDHPA